MSKNAWISSADALKRLPAVVAAVDASKELTDLWPLTDHMHIDNDVKYAESFQVRTTRQFALVLTGEDVTVPDAEYVYEGADEIPGRPQNIVDALLAANDAYDETVDFSDDGDAGHIVSSAELLGDVWNEPTADAVREVVEAAEAAGAALAADDVAGRYALGAAAFADVLAEVSEHAADGAAAVKAALPTVLYFNEFDERLGIPRVFVTADELEALRALAVAGPADDANATAFVDKLLEIAKPEWTKHHDDVLWDPVEAKKKAKEEDEKRSKAALAAKFAHIKDDPNKEEVEL
ncbi:hypothetical protein GFD17_05650 [Bifidobacterium sp. SMB2]|uniref:Uncharacterized protein n=1 Tax=Bifidobacterium saimiriisciurei TaxID=2661627 RepID=A0ABX0CJ00_9BIFI|nr:MULTISPECIES: hypothetical protein [Bifidobacterium]NEG96244.1 hypothetical protein [Bifidobacterium sp. SMB2]NEH12257.1 hypothetical protein [Bifidobacterium saimiriisciurei]